MARGGRKKRRSHSDAHRYLEAPHAWRCEGRHGKYSFELAVIDAHEHEHTSAASEMCHEYGVELEHVSGLNLFTATFQSFSKEIVTLPGKYGPEEGGYDTANVQRAEAKRAIPWPPLLFVSYF